MSGSTPAPLPRIAWPVLLTAVCLLGAEPGRPPVTDKPKPPEAARVELHRLDNDDLLKRATGTYDKAARDYLAAARALAAAERMLQEANQRKDEDSKPKSAPPTKATTAEDKAQAAVEAARAKHAGATARLKRVQAGKQLLDRVSAGIESGQSAGVAFAGALDDLKPYAVEIGLRIEDESLADAKVPVRLKQEELDRKRKD